MTLSASDRELLLQTFLTEATEHLHTLEEGLVALERRPNDAELVNEIFRLAHSLKGDATLVGFNHIAELAHVVEDLLERLRDEAILVTPELVNLLLRAVDVLAAMVRGAGGADEAPPAAWDILRDDLRAAALAGGGAAPSPASRAPHQLPTPSSDAEARTLRVEIGKLDRLLNLTGEISIARARLAQLVAALPGHLGRDILEAHHEADGLLLDLQEQVMRARMVPVGPFFRQYARTVRDLASAHGKAVSLVIEGGEVEVDTRIVERLRDPLTHMIRNTIDHGIETPELRAAVGKAAEGRLTLCAAHEGGQIVIQVKDDGAGFNCERIAEHARTLGLSTRPEDLPEADLLALVFAPGFSTARAVTDLSGRGVGMDVVRRNIEALRGTIEIASIEGEGATITIRLPLTLAIIDAFSVGVGEDTYVLPLESVRECLSLPKDAHRDGPNRSVMSLRGKPLPVLRLRELFHHAGAPAAREHVVVVSHGDALAGIAVDALHGEGQAVIKSLGRTLGTLPGLSGSTILGNGRVALILDVAQLLVMAQSRS